MFAWTPVSGQEGVYQITFTASDGFGEVDTEAVVITIRTNALPIWNALGSYAVATSHTLTFPVSASDADRDPVSITSSPLPPGATFLDHVFAWTPAPGQEGAYEVTFTADDSFGAVDTEVVAITVRTNAAPALWELGAYTTQARSQLYIGSFATDADGDVLTYSASPLPAGATFSGGVFKWTPADDQVGEYTVVFTASDPYAASDTEAVWISVVPGPAHFRAFLTWSAASVVADLSNPGASNDLYIRVEGASSFKGAEFDLTWNPPGNDTDCYTHIATLFETGDGTSCMYLNRGTVISVTTDDAPGHLHVAWASDQANLRCINGGNAVVIRFAFDGCADSVGCFTLQTIKILDYDNHRQIPEIAGPKASVRGGGVDCVTTDVDSLSRPLSRPRTLRARSTCARA
jgi:hypothetical protein